MAVRAHVRDRPAAADTEKMPCRVVWMQYMAGDTTRIQLGDPPPWGVRSHSCPSNAEGAEQPTGATKEQPTEAELPLMGRLNAVAEAWEAGLAELAGVQDLVLGPRSDEGNSVEGPGEVMTLHIR